MRIAALLALLLPLTALGATLAPGTYTVPAGTKITVPSTSTPPPTCTPPSTLVNGICTAPVPPSSGVPWTPPAGSFAVYAYGGARGFTLDNSYGGLVVNYADTSHPIPPGPNDISLQGNNGGWQPRYRDPGNFSTAGFTSLVIVAILQPGQDFQVGLDQSNGSGGDAIIPGANQAYLVAGGYGPAGDGKTYHAYVIPLGKGGFNIAPGQNILKFSFQNSGAASASTTAYIGGAYFSP